MKFKLLNFLLIFILFLFSVSAQPSQIQDTKFIFSDDTIGVNDFTEIAAAYNIVNNPWTGELSIEQVAPAVTITDSCQSGVGIRLTGCTDDIGLGCNCTATNTVSCIAQPEGSLNITWTVQGCEEKELTSYGTVRVSGTQNFIFDDLDMLEVITKQLFSVSACPQTTAGALLLGFFIIIALIIVFLGVMSGHGFIGFFGAVMLLALSWFIAPCINILGFIMAAFSLVLMVFFAVVGLGMGE